MKFKTHINNRWLCLLALPLLYLLLFSIFPVTNASAVTRSSPTECDFSFSERQTTEEVAQWHPGSGYQEPGRNMLVIVATGDCLLSQSNEEVFWFDFWDEDGTPSEGFNFWQGTGTTAGDRINMSSFGPLSPREMGSTAARYISHGDRDNTGPIISIDNRQFAENWINNETEVSDDGPIFAPGSEEAERDLDANDSEATTCEDSGGFAWAFCAALRLFSSGLDFIDQSLEGWLRMERDRFDRAELRDAWAVIRNIAYMLLVPVMLVMIIGTALGFEFVSAYTVKKALPRMVVATIFIALSYDLAVLFVDAVQAIGDGIHNILLLPFRDILEWTELTRETRLSDVAVRPTNGASGAAAGTALSAGVLALVGVAAASVWGGGLVATVAGFIGVALLILVAVFALLLARQTLVIALILFSPIALIAWIFPGRTTLFTLWSKTFWLMMWFYPVIMITTAVGKILAALVASGG